MGSDGLSLRTRYFESERFIHIIRIYSFLWMYIVSLLGAAPAFQRSSAVFLTPISQNVSLGFQRVFIIYRSLHFCRKLVRRRKQLQWESTGHCCCLCLFGFSSSERPTVETHLCFMTGMCLTLKLPLWV